MHVTYIPAIAYIHIYIWLYKYNEIYILCILKYTRSSIIRSIYTNPSNNSFQLAGEASATHPIFNVNWFCRSRTSGNVGFCLGTNRGDRPMIPSTISHVLGLPLTVHGNVKGLTIAPRWSSGHFFLNMAYGIICKQKRWTLYIIYSSWWGSPEL